MAAAAAAFSKSNVVYALQEYYKAFSKPGGASKTPHLHYMMLLLTHGAVVLPDGSCQVRAVAKNALLHGLREEAVASDDRAYYEPGASLRAMTEEFVRIELLEDLGQGVRLVRSALLHLVAAYPAPGSSGGKAPPPPQPQQGQYQEAAPAAATGQAPLFVVAGFGSREHEPPRKRARQQSPTPPQQQAQQQPQQQQPKPAQQQPKPTPKPKPAQQPKAKPQPKKQQQQQQQQQQQAQQQQQGQARAQPQQEQPAARQEGGAGRPIVVAGVSETAAAVDWMAQASASLNEPIAVDAEGDLRQGGAVSLVQARCSYRTYVFDLQAMGGAYRRAAAKHLDRLLGDEAIAKVMHDSRRKSEALFYLLGIRCRGLWDTQAAHGLSQLLRGLGGEGEVGFPLGLNDLLARHGLPPNPYNTAIHLRLRKERDLLTRRPLDAQLLDFADAEVVQLAALCASQQRDLGASGAAAVLKLGLAYSEWHFADPDRTWAVQGAYRSAGQLPAGCDLQLTIEPPQYLPRMSFPPFLGEASKAGPPGPSQAAAATAAAAVPAADGEDGEDGEDPDVAVVLSLFPPHVQAALRALFAPGGAPAGEGGAGAAAPAQQQRRSKGRRQRDLVEVVVDSGRPVVARFADGGEEDLPATLCIEEAMACLAAAKAMALAGPRGASLFCSEDNRTGVPGTLNRISALRGRGGHVLGLTYRIGRHVPGVAALIGDILASLSVRNPGAAAAAGITAAGPGGGGGGSAPADDGLGTPSLLLLGPPGVGKTTLLREVSGLLADTFRKRVIVVDTSNEIAGDGTVPHACIGRARRMQVPDRARQHHTLVEAVQNHNPEAIVVDEIGSAAEVAAVRSIAQRGVVMVGTAHGTSLEALLKNPELNSLVGGVHQVLLGDMEAKASNAGVKTKTERRGAPAFSTLVEVVNYGVWRVHHSVARSVDDILAGRQPATQLRWVRPDGVMMVRREGSEAGPEGFLKKVLDRVGEREAAAAAKPSDWLAHLLNLAAMY